MDKKAVLSFVNEIIKNGIENNLDANLISKGLIEYAEYLKNNHLVEEGTIKAIKTMATQMSQFLDNNPIKKEPSIVEHSSPSSCHSGRSINRSRC